MDFSHLWVKCVWQFLKCGSPCKFSISLHNSSVFSSANAVTVCLFFLSKNWSNTTVQHLLGKGNEVKVLHKPKETTEVYFALFAKQW